MLFTLLDTVAKLLCTKLVLARVDQNIPLALEVRTCPTLPIDPLALIAPVIPTDPFT